MRSVIEEAARQVRAAGRQPGYMELASFENLLEAVREYGAPRGQQAEVLEMIAGRNRALFSQFALPIADFEAVGNIEEQDWLFIRLQLALLRAAREVTESS